METACTKDDALLSRAMALCSDAKPGEDGEAIGEPTECALVNFAAKAGPDKTALDAESPRIGEIPFDSDRKMMTTVCRTLSTTKIIFPQYSSVGSIRRENQIR